MFLGAALPRDTDPALATFFGLTLARLHALAWLYDRGGHFVLVTNLAEKRPIWADYHRPRNRPTMAQVLHHLESGGVVGIIPASIGLAVIDVDQVDRQFGLLDLVKDHPPLLYHQSSRPGHWHLWYLSRQPQRQRNGLRAARYGATFDVRGGGAGYVVLYQPWSLAFALEWRLWRPGRPSQGGSFPGELLEESPAVARPARAAAATRVAADRVTIPVQRPLLDAGVAPPHFAAIGSYRDQTLFEALRDYFKRRRRGGQDPDAEAAWRRRVAQTALIWNQAFPEPLSEAKVLSTAKSVAGFLWRNPRYGTRYFEGCQDSAVQRRRQELQVASRRRRHAPRDRRIWALRQQGRSLREIARDDRVRLTHQRVGQLLKGWSGPPPEAAIEDVKFAIRPPRSLQRRNRPSVGLDGVIRNNRLSVNRHKKSESQRKALVKPLIAGNNDGIQLTCLDSVTQVVDNSALTVDNQASSSPPGLPAQLRGPAEIYQVTLSADGYARLQRLLAQKGGSHGVGSPGPPE